jgi:hypothetical protein
MSINLQNLKSIVHIKIVLIAVLVVSVVGFAGYRVQSAQNNSEDNKSTTKQASTLNNNVNNNVNPVVAVSDNPTVAVTIKTEESVASKPVPAAPVQQKELTNKTVVFTKGGGSADANNVTVSSTASEKLNGTCTYLFKLGNSQVTESVKVNNSQTCSINIPISRFPKNGEWQYTMTYKSNDGITTGGSANPGIIYLYAEEPRAISFSKGGATDSVSESSPFNASFKLSESPQSGTCEHWFYGYNSGSQLTKTTQISNGDKCEITIPVADFPVKDNYQYQVSFTSNDGKIVAYMIYFDKTNVLTVTK